MKEEDPGINPWMTMWTQPQKTIRAVINTNPQMGFYFLASVWFLQFFFLFESYYSLKFPIHWILTILIAVVISPIIGTIGFYFVGWLVFITGKCLKGQATQVNTRCAYAWSRLPLIIDLIMWFTISAFIKELIFERIGVDISFIFINLVAVVTSIWSFVLLIGAVKEIQKFSLIKSILNVVIVYIILSVIMFVISYLFHQIIYN